jgi:hypothetical protein
MIVHPEQMIVLHLHFKKDITLAKDSWRRGIKRGRRRGADPTSSMLHGGAIFHPPPWPRAGAGAGADDATVERGSKAPSPSQGGKKRSGSNIATVAWGGEPPPPPLCWRGSNPQQIQQNKRTKKGKTKKRSKPPFLSPTQGRISYNPSTNTLSTGGSMNDSFATPQSFESPQFDCINVGRETFLNDDTDKEYKYSHCLEPYLVCNFDPKINPFLFSFANIDFADNVSRVWRGCRIVP